MAKASVLVVASNYGLWAEELQAPWDAMKAAGFDLTLATYKGLTPLPHVVSLDPTFIDPMQNVPMNPQAVVDRTLEILDSGEWAHPIKVADARMADYDAIILTGGPGAPLDIVGNPKLHRLILEAYQAGKLIGGLCYSVGTLAMVRDPDHDHKSIVYGRTVVAHPHEWDFDFDLSYPLARTTPDNPGTDVVTPGGLLPLQWIMEDAVGPQGRVIADAQANREHPCLAWDDPILTALSVESSLPYGQRIVEILNSR